MISFLPRQASTFAPQTDALYFTLLGISGAIALLVFALIVVFSIRYRRGSSAKRGALPPLIQREFEIGWTSVTLFAFLMLFWWAGSNEVSQLLPPHDATEIHVVAKHGCGRSSTRTARARSTPFTCRWTSWCGST